MPLDKHIYYTKTSCDKQHLSARGEGGDKKENVARIRIPHGIKGVRWLMECRLETGPT